MLLLLVPSVIYAAMFAGQVFPPTERAAAGIPFSHMFKEMLRPLFLVIWFCMWLTAATELGPGQWMSNIFNEVMQSSAQAGILVLVWVNGIMYAIRHFFGGAAHRFSPVALIAVTAVAAAIGLFLFGNSRTPVTAFASAALFAAGTALWWPAMLGITSERFPRGGALLLAVIGASGAFSTAIAGPVMGWINERYGADHVLAIWAALPAGLVVIFTAIYLRDRLAGGYKVERIGTPARSV
jgi:hypothetical protein